MWSEPECTLLLGKLMKDGTDDFSMPLICKVSVVGKISENEDAATLG